MKVAENEVSRTETFSEKVTEEMKENESEVAVESKPMTWRRGFVLPKVSRKTIIMLMVIAVITGAATYVAYTKKGWFIAAMVNGSPITRLSVIEELEKQAGKDALDTMITKRLIADDMKRSGVIVKQEDIDSEMKKAEEQIAAQGGTLDEALAQQRLTRDDLLEQIIMKKKLEQILAEKIAVNESDIDQYLKTSKTVPVKGMNSTDLREQVRKQLESQKFSIEVQSYITDLRAKASIIDYSGY